MLEIDPKDLKIEVYDPSPYGGQHVTRTSCGIQVTHLPTGLLARCDLARSQHKNKAICLDMILTALTYPGV